MREEVIADAAREEAVVEGGLHGEQSKTPASGSRKQMGARNVIQKMQVWAQIGRRSWRTQHLAL
jgi:hypothetical protein